MTQKRIRIEYSEVQESVFFNWPKGIKFKTFRKGRRTGATKGASNAYIEKMISSPVKLLWGDTVHPNINRYVDRYFKPVLKDNKIDYHWSERDKQLLIGDSLCDFRSSDQPENWEGFGYHEIFLNEAGIILKNKDLYTKTVLPMLLDFPESKLVAAGVPKGKVIKDGTEHMFYTLYNRSIEDPTKYMDHVATPYDNPWLNADEIKALEAEMFAIGGQALVDQEIYGRFVDGVKGNTFIIHFDHNRHISSLAKLDVEKKLYLSIDFNLTPFGLIAAHIWFDRAGFHCHIVDELQIENGSIPAMIDAIKSRYYPWLPTLELTGDHQGTRGELSQRDNASYYQQLRRGLGLSASQLYTPSNPTHENSRGDCNYVFANHPDFKISPNCKGVIFDINNVEIDAYGQIAKRNRNIAAQRADLLDTLRYMINAFVKDWIKNHLKQSQYVKK